MGYKLKKHSGATRSANRNHILSKQSTKRKRHNRGLNKLSGSVLKVAQKLVS